MRKRLVALALVLVMLVTPALAVVHSSAMGYSRPTLTPLRTYSADMIEALSRDNAMSRISMLYKGMQNEYEKIVTMYSLATLRRHQNANNKTLATEVTECYKVLVDAFEIMRDTTVAMFESPYEDQFRSIWGDAVVDSVLASDPLTDEEREIEEKISEKLAEYSTLSATPSAVIDGKRIALNDAKTLEQRREIYSLWQREMGELYLDLVALRKESVGEYTNYLRYAYQGYYRDYSLENARALETMVSDSLSVVYDKLGRVFDSYTTDRLDLEMSMTDAVDLVSDALGGVDGSLTDSYRIMKQNKLYDIEYSDHKSSAGFTITLPSYQSPFLYFRPDGHINGLHTFFHEFGHFHQLLNSDLHSYWPGNVTDLDASEVTSQALPLLVGGQMPDLLGEKVGTLLRQYSVDSTLFALLTGCMVDEFEQFVYYEYDLTVDRLNEKFGELVKKYHIPWDKTVWTQIDHIYETPGYYISYAVSAITAMEIWETFETNPTLGSEKYLTAVEVCPDGYRTLLSKARLRNPFSAPELLAKIRTLIEAEFSLLVDTYGHWAEVEVDELAKIGVVSGYLEDDGKHYFHPDQTVTRAEFVKLLYNLAGGSEETFAEQFSDVNDTDWFAQPVAWAAENGLVNGVDETRFDPSGTITRQDMAVILERFLVFCQIDLPDEKSVEFTDGDQIAEYARFAVAHLQDAEVLNGLPDGRFNPRGSVTRAAAARALHTTIDVVAADEETRETSATVTIPAVPVQAKLLSMTVH